MLFPSVVRPCPREPDSCQLRAVTTHSEKISQLEDGCVNLRSAGRVRTPYVLNRGWWAIRPVRSPFTERGWLLDPGSKLTLCYRVTIVCNASFNACVASSAVFCLSVVC
jgi:hypothetical protein